LTLSYHFLALLTSDYRATASCSSIVSLGWKFSGDEF